MKKILFYACGAALALTSCSNEELVEVSSGDTITFRASMALNDASRGDDIHNNNIYQFMSTAVEQSEGTGGNLFNNVIFRKGTDGEFRSDKSYLWYKDADLKFYAWSYYNRDKSDIVLSKIGDISINKEEAKIKNFSPQKDISDQIDLVGATAQEDYDGRIGAVGLNFDHLLSQIQVLAKTDNKTYVFYVRGVKFCNVVSQGDYDFNNAAWTLKEDVISNYEVRYEDRIWLESEPKDISKLTQLGYAMLMPQTLAKWDVAADRHNENKAPYLAVLLQIRAIDTDLQVFPLTRLDASGNEVYNEGKYAWACIPLDNTWQPGHRITYILDFSHGAGYTDPDPDPDDPDTPDPDPENEGKPILEGLIKCTVKVDDWIQDNPLYPNPVGPNTGNDF